jgi:hypothetical protein
VLIIPPGLLHRMPIIIFSSRCKKDHATQRGPARRGRSLMTSGFILPWAQTTSSNQTATSLSLRGPQCDAPLSVSHLLGRILTSSIDNDGGSFQHHAVLIPYVNELLQIRIDKAKVSNVSSNIISFTRPIHLSLPARSLPLLIRDLIPSSSIPVSRAGEKISSSISI